MLRVRWWAFVWRRYGAVLVALLAGLSLTEGCASTETNPYAIVRRARPRRRAARTALRSAARRAAQCLPRGMEATVSGTFDGPTGSFHVSDVQGGPAQSTLLRACVTEAFEYASVEPFTEARYVARPTRVQGDGEALPFARTGAAPSTSSGGASSSSTSSVSSTASAGSVSASDAGAGDAALASDGGGAR